MVGEGVCGWREPVGKQGGSMSHQFLMDGLPDGIHDTVGSTSPCCPSRARSAVLLFRAHYRLFYMEWERCQSLCQHPEELRKQVLTHISHFPLWEKSWTEISFNMELCHLRGEVTWANWNGSSYSLQFSSVTQLCLTLCNPMGCSTSGFPVHHHLPEFTQTHVHWVCDAIQQSHPLSSLSSPGFNLS